MLKWLLTAFTLTGVYAHMDDDMGTSIPYGDICMGILGTNYAFAGPDCTSSYRKAPCYCNNTAFLQSVVACVQKYAANTSMPANTSDTAYAQVIDMCPTVSLNELTNLEGNTSSLPSYYGMDSGLKPGHWPAQSAFALTDFELDNAVKAYLVPLGRMKKNMRYGASLLAYWGGILAVRGAVHWLSALFPRLPLVSGNTRLTRAVRAQLQIHSHRSLMLAVLGFIVLTVLVTFCDIPFYSPDYSFQYSSMASYGHLLGSRTGIFCIYLMPLFFLFAGRNNFLQWLTGWNQEQFLVFHRYIARVAIALLLAHTIAFSVQRAAVHMYSQMWHTAYWNWGVAGLAFAAFIFVQAIRFIRRKNYELFLVAHMIAAIVFLITGYYHLKLLDEDDDVKFYWATIAVWAADHAARLLRTFYNGAQNCTIELVDDDNNMLLLSLDRPKWWPLAIAPGTCAFVHFLKPSFFWQSHPLTLATDCSDPSKLKLFFRVYGGISKTLANMVLNSPENKLEMKILLDGPYGTSRDMLEYDECVFIAGGSGIMAPLAYVQNSVMRFPSRKFQKIVLHWAVANESALSWFEQELKFLREEADVHVYVSGKRLESVSDTHSTLEEKDVAVTTADISVSSDKPSEGSSLIECLGRLSVQEVVRKTVSNAAGNVCIMCCGPASLHSETRNAVAANLNKTTQFVDYFEETYTW